LIFKTLKSLKNAAVWKDYKDTAQLNFAKKTLIYGFNGSGKTTLSRVFLSILDKKLVEKLPSETQFSLALSDGKTISSSSLANPFEKSLLVFNEDFIRRNFQWEESKAAGIAYISENSVTKVSDLEAAIKHFDQATLDYETKKIATKAAEKTLKDFRTDVARRIRDFDLSKRHTTQQYDARKIDPEYAKRDFSDDDLLSADEIKKRQMLLGQDEALPPIQTSCEIDFDIKNWVSNTLVLLSQTPGSILSEEFKEHTSALTWVNQGLQYHIAHDLHTCLLCANPLTEKRKEILAKNFDDTWDSFSASIQKTFDECQTHTDKLRLIFSSVPKETELQSAERSALKELSPDVIEKIKEMGTYLKSLSELLQQKVSSPTTSLLPASDVNIHTWVEEYEKLTTTLSEILQRHNKAYEEFELQQKSAFEAIKHHVLAEERDKNSEYKKSQIDAQALEKTAKDTLEAAKNKRNQIQNELSNHGIGAEKLNKMLAAYLGHKDIQLNALEVGYQLIRSDGKPATQLSEGEQTALAFCYFLTLFEAENRKKKELVVIIDDPISSLDTSARTHAFSLMSRMTKNCAQTIILTHNLAFMNMVKGGFNSLQRKRPDEKICALFTLECTSEPETSESRITCLTDMNPLLKNYDTEYQYLFEMVKLASDNKETEQSYMLPNATRKLLEMFTAFSSPNAENFTAALMSNHEKLKDKLEIKSLERLIQLESHGTLEGFSNLPVLSVEEAIKASEAAMIFIRELAPNHHKEMVKCIENHSNA